MDVNNYFNSDFSDIFNDSGMKEEATEDDIVQFMSLLGGKNSVEIRYENVCNIVYKFLHKTPLEDMEGTIFRHVMPEIRDLFVTSYKDISNILHTTKSQTSSDSTLKVLRECVLTCVGSYEVLHTILTILLQNGLIQYCYIETVPTELLNILLSTFHHCKESEHVYHKYFSELQEIVQLFKSAQDTHSKLLQLLVSHVTFNFEIAQQIDWLKNVLYGLSEIGVVLLDMNLKTLADNWKGYMAIIEKNSDILNANHFSVKKPLDFIALLIKQNLENVLKMNNSDPKSYNYVLKMCNFFVKIVIKLCDICWQQNDELQLSVLHFLLSVYKFYSPYLRFKGYCDNISNGIQTLVIKSCDSIIIKCLYDIDFLKVFGAINVKDNSNSPGMLFFMSEVFNKIQNDSDRHAYTFQADVLVDIYFKIIRESYVELFWDIAPNTLPLVSRTLFDENCANIAKMIANLNAEGYNKVEVILMKNVLQEDIWSALTALQIWHSVLRCKGAELTYETLLNIISVTKIIIGRRFSHSPVTVFIKYLLQLLYRALPEEYRITLIENYSIQSHLQLWCCFTLNNFPSSCTAYIESLLINVIETIDEFKNGKFTVDDFYFLSESMDLISTLSTCLDLSSLIDSTLKLWDLDVNLSVIKHNPLLKYFLRNLLKLTNHLLTNLSENQLAYVFVKVKDLSSSLFHIEILQMLKQLSHRTLNQYPEKNQIISVTSVIFNLIYSNSNPIIKQLFLETFVYFLNNTAHEEILQSVIKVNNELEHMVTSFIQQNVTSADKLKLLSADDYFSEQKCYKFQHKCLQGLQTVNRVNTDSDNLNVIVKRIKSDLESLFRLSNRRFVENTVSEVLESFN